MKNIGTTWKTALLAMAIAGLTGCTANTSARQAQPTRLAHTVFFTLNDNSPAQKDALVRECRAYLKDHPGVLAFWAGTLAEELDRPVNVTDFDVSLHLLFSDAASHDRYQTAPKHLEFIERNKANWKQVRVFDSRVY